MSKISLKGSLTGTGTLTIESPVTNDDRTLVLPDEAGAIVVEQAGNVAYKQSNILGTVSQSSGVPTGAIIERGSNANGEFVRYADGTQICTRIVSHDFSSTSTVDYNFPVAFVGGTTILPSCASGVYTNGAARINAFKDFVVMARADFGWRVSSQTTTSETLSVALFVTGIWY